MRTLQLTTLALAMLLSRTTTQVPPPRPPIIEDLCDYLEIKLVTLPARIGELQLELIELEGLPALTFEEQQRLEELPGLILELVVKLGEYSDLYDEYDCDCRE